MFAGVAPNVSAHVLKTAAGASARESFDGGVACDAAIRARLTSLAAIEDGNIEFAGFTVAQRRGEDTVNLQASMLHTQLAAGRAFLRRSHDPA